MFLRKSALATGWQKAINPIDSICHDPYNGMYCVHLAPVIIEWGINI